MAAVSFSDAEALWVNNGGPAWAAPIAASIAGAESAFGAAPLGDYSGGQPTSFGLWQIHTPAHPQYDANQLVNDPNYNAAAAVQIFKRAGNTFTDWTTFNNGSYIAFLTDANANGTMSSGAQNPVTPSVPASAFSPASLSASATSTLIIVVVLVLFFTLYGMTRTQAAT